MTMRSGALQLPRIRFEETVRWYSAAPSPVARDKP